jgi:pantoate--beta-alanine ligase
VEIITDVAALQARTLGWRAGGLRVGFVPTMGFLHRGHTSLMSLARPRCDKVVVSIFVNPLQFGPAEDLDRYPRDPEGDAAKCEAAGVDLLFVPDTAGGGFYPGDFSTTVAVSGLTSGLCGGKRPGHFEGVTTVVARLFGMVQPSLAVFGEKDYQQLAVIRRMVRDLAMPIEVVGGPLVRDDDGLALSSRNAYLSDEQRARGLSLHRALVAIAASPEREVAALKARGQAMIEADRLDYLEIVDAETLAPLAEVDRPARALAAGFFGATRLIDNVAIAPK